MAKKSEEKKSSEELKRKLERVIKSIVEDDDDDDQAMQILNSLKILKLNHQNIFSFSHDQLIPNEFICPLSGHLMQDPVVLASGQTYDRKFIRNWLKDGNRTCPRTQKVLSHTVLTPNHLVREMISKWYNDHALELPCPSSDDNNETIANADRHHLNSLLQKISSSCIEVQNEAAKKLRVLTKQMPYFRVLFGEIINSIPRLLDPLSKGRPDTHPDLQENLIATVFNLSIHDSNKKLMAENPIAIPILIESLTFGKIETRRNAAAALFTLSALDSNKSIIANFGALGPLINLIEEGHPLAMKDAASAIFNLCILIENRGVAVSEGAVRVIMKKLRSRVLVDELLAILAMLSSHRKAIEEMVERGGVSFLLSIIQDNVSERSKENCVAILYTMCFNDRAKLREINRDEDAYRTISRLAQNGTSRARRKADGILELLDRYASAIHCG